MTIEILKEKHCDEVPSGSGLTYWEGQYYVVGDDSPYLYTLDKQFNVRSKRLLAGERALDAKRIAKPLKTDYEALELIEGRELLALGSGSLSPQRDVAVRMTLEPPFHMRRYACSALYAQLRALPQMRGSELNIEALAYSGDLLYVFNRRRNVLFTFEYARFIHALEGRAPFSMKACNAYSLPVVHGVEAGFSGATAYRNGQALLFTASLEHTDNAYDDGEVLGSMLGSIALHGGLPQEQYSYALMPAGYEKLKIESVAVVEELSENTIVLALVADDDQGGSTFISCTLHTS